MENPPDISATRMRTFLAVAETGSVRAAAARLHVTEPAVSTSLSQLARQLDVALVTRQGRGLRLTPAGDVYADHCRSILGLMTRAHTAVQDATRGRLRIGAVATASEVVLPPALARFREHYPDVSLSLVVAPRDQLFDRLRHHEVDLVIGGRPPQGLGLVTRASRANSLVVVGAPGVGEDYVSVTWLLRGLGSGIRATTVALLDQLEVAPATLTLGTHGAVVASAREGLGITLVHADAVTEDLARGRLVEVPVPRTPMDRPWIVVSTRSVVPAARLFLNHLADPGPMAGPQFHLANPTQG